MRERLFALFWEDRAARAKMYACTFAFSILLWVMLSIGGTPDPEATNDVMASALGMLVLWTVLYCSFGRRQSAWTPEEHLNRRLALAGIATTISLGASLSMQEIVHAILRRRLHTALSTPKQLEEKLPEVNATLQLANTANLKVEGDVAEEIKKELQRIPPTSPDYWQTIGTFITQQTVIAKGISFERALSLPSCSSLPQATSNPDGSLRNYKGLHGSCGPGEALDVDGWYFENSSFKNVLIRYRGTAPVTFVNTTFVNCQFFLILQSQPSPMVQELALAVLKNPDLVEFKT